MARPLLALFTPVHGVDFVLVVIACEFLVLSLRPRAAGRGGLADRVFAFAPGILLVLALRAALAGAGFLWIGGFLAASFPFHLMDLRRRRL
jgi:hypothetical protein